MELSENLKLNNAMPSGDLQQDRLSRSLNSIGANAQADNADDAESQMRKALGLLGEGPRHRVDAERTETPNRSGDRFSGGLHRRRFVQDGDVPVTVLRREPGHEAPAHRSSVSAAVPPTTSRLQRTEAALAGETAAREKAERLLSETQMIVRDLQTKIGHAELAKNEAIETLRREREAAAQGRADMDAREARFLTMQARAQAAEDAAQTYQEQLQEERQARKALEKALKTTEAALEAAEQLVRTLSEDVQEQHKHQDEAPTARVIQSSTGLVDDEQPSGELAEVAVRKTESVHGGKSKAEAHGSLFDAEPEVAPAAARRARVQADAVAEPEPVKWWLNTKAGSKRR